ncbi:hypothetical protein UCREL1_7541 [Eutypa lata UCREL1]|uniref:Uncharacterized protein n=1 Tax=Eutypa lata (strain UCR-EL1) TaxID=1287681 RepID=M7T6N8_EUTLA|nr:hypothetical protein UCREL1_7541 [Eutypa lata UCREL1]
MVVATTPRRRERFLVRKAREVQHVQIMGGIAFAAFAGALSWADHDKMHWLGLACWFGSLMLALGSVVLGVQQRSLIDALQDLASPPCLEKHFRRPYQRWFVIFTWQAPLMMVNYSFILFTVGLLDYVVNPVVRSGVFDDHARVNTKFV